MCWILPFTIIVGTQHGDRVWLSLDCCGLTCVFFTYAIISYSCFTVSKIVIYDWLGLSAFGVIHLVVFNSMLGLGAVSHLKAMMTDPGIYIYIYIYSVYFSSFICNTTQRAHNSFMIHVQTRSKLAHIINIPTACTPTRIELFYTTTTTRVHYKAKIAVRPRII